LATAILIFQDLCVVPIVLLVPFLAGTAKGGGLGLAVALGKAALIVLGVILASRLLVPRLLKEILKTRSREMFLITIILLVTLTALGTAAAGASLALGAFLAGLVLSESDYGHQALAELLPFRDVFISLFFVAVGMLVDVAFLRAHPWATLGGVALVVGGKMALAAAGSDAGAVARPRDHRRLWPERAQPVGGAALGGGRVFGGRAQRRDGAAGARAGRAGVLRRRDARGNPARARHRARPAVRH